MGWTTPYERGTPLTKGPVECDKCFAQTREGYYGRRDSTSLACARWRKRWNNIKKENEWQAFCPKCQFEENEGRGWQQKLQWAVEKFEAHWMLPSEPTLAIEDADRGMWASQEPPTSFEKLAAGHRNVKLPRWDRGGCVYFSLVQSPDATQRHWYYSGSSKDEASTTSQPPSQTFDDDDKADTEFDNPWLELHS